MKQSLVLLFVLVIFSCKKKTQEPEILPDTYVDPSYFGSLESHLNIGVGNNGPVDSTFSSLAYLWERSANLAPYVGFNKAAYNNRGTSTIDNGIKFLGFANQSNWDLQSTFIGNFTHVDNTPTPLISNAGGLVPLTFSGMQLNIDLHNITNADQVVVRAFDGGMDQFNTSQTFMVNGRSDLSLPFTQGVLSLPLNREIRITVSLWKFNKLSRSNAEIDVAKVTNYSYKTKKTS